MSDELPLISVVTPSFNQARFLETTIRSVLGQGYPNLEYIVMDGGSSDGSVEIIRRYANQLAFWISEKDAGQADAINRGFARATGDILCWINSDDFHFPDALHTAAQVLGPTRSEPGLAYGACLFFRDATSEARVVAPPPHDATRLRLTDYVIQPSAFWTHALWNKTGSLDGGLHFAFDWDWFIRASEHGVFNRVNHIFSAYRKHAEHKSGSGDARRREEILTVARRHGSPAQVACFDFVASRAAAFDRRTRRAATLARWNARLEGPLSRLFTRGLRLPPGIRREDVEACRGMLS